MLFLLLIFFVSRTQPLIDLFWGAMHTWQTLIDFLFVFGYKLLLNVVLTLVIEITRPCELKMFVLGNICTCNASRELNLMDLINFF